MALDELESCTVCPRNCRIDRLHAVRSDGKLDTLLEPEHIPGQALKRTVPTHIAKGTSCFTDRYARVSSAFAHFGEEDCFAGGRAREQSSSRPDNLRCVSCQNWDISQAGEGRELCAADLAEMMLDLQARGCHNINFVTPEHVVPQLLEGLLIVAHGGLRLPIVYNTSAYDSLRSLELLDGVVDIYMPDFKYWDAPKARRHVKAEDYPEVARRTIREMHRQVGPLVFDSNRQSGRVDDTFV